MMVSLLTVTLFAICMADTYTEDLLITKLRSGHFLSQFKFSITSEHHIFDKEYELFPRVIAELISQYSVKELSLSLGMGRWSTEEWGLPPQPNAPTGAYVHAWIGGNETEVDEKWQRVVNSLNGMICTSLTAVIPTLTSSPPNFAQTTSNYGNEARFRYAALAKETVCTENLTPWRKLLPCKQNGLTTLLNPLKLYDSHFHSIGIKTIANNLNNQMELILTLNLVSPLIISKSSEVDVETVFGRKIVGMCHLAEHSLVWVAAPSIVSNKEVPPGYELKKNFLLINLHDEAFLKNPRIDYSVHSIKNNCSTVSIKSKIGGTGDYVGSIITIVTNYGDSRRAVFSHTIPWFVQIHYHTLELRCEQDNQSVRPKLFSHFFSPAVSRGAPAVVEYDFEFPDNSQCFVEFQFKKAFLRLREYPPDASHGMYVPSATLIIKEIHDLVYPGSDLENFNKESMRSIILHGNVLLVILPVPDFSMPFNVICFVLTTITLCFGPIHNFSTKMFIPLNSNLPVAPKYRKFMRVFLLLLLGLAIYAQYYEIGLNEIRRMIGKSVENVFETFEKMNSL